MQYSYQTGKYSLQSVAEGGNTTNFSYNALGNFTSDGNTTVQIYDWRNMPLQVQVGANDHINYNYDESGSRIGRYYGNANEYYLRDASGRELAIFDMATQRPKQINLFAADQIGTADVYPGTNGISLTKQYFLKDHLGSTRVVLNDAGACFSARDYYPYGQTLREYTIGTTNRRYQFNGKERDIVTDLDYSIARYYNAKLGVWLSVDPLLDKFPGFSPFIYCSNNPINRIDPYGMEDDPIRKIQQDGQNINTYMKSVMGSGTLSPSSSYQTSWTYSNNSGQKNTSNSNNKTSGGADAQKGVVAQVSAGAAIGTGTTGFNFSFGFNINTNDWVGNLFFKWGTCAGVGLNAGLEGNVLPNESLNTMNGSGSRFDSSPGANTFDFVSGYGFWSGGTTFDQGNWKSHNNTIIGLGVGTPSIMLQGTNQTFTSPSTQLKPFLIGPAPNLFLRF